MGRYIRILIGIGLLALVLSFANWHEVGAVLRKVDLAWVAWAFALAMIDRVVLNYRWQVLLAARGVQIGFWRLFRVQLAANFIGSFLPSSLGVDAVRIAALCRMGEPAPAVIASAVVDRASIVLATFVLGSATILLLAQTRVPPNVARLVLLSTLVGVLICAAALLPAVRRWVRLSLVPRLPERVRHTAHDIAEAALAYRHDTGMWGKVAISTVLTFAVRIAFAKAVVLACGVDVPFTDLLLVIPILWIIVMLPITIGGIGVQDAGYVGLMALLGIAPAVAVSMSLIEHVVTRAAGLPGAFFLEDATTKLKRDPDESRQRRGN
jgi:uncharacterized protein (TIRG00374 family)